MISGVAVSPVVPPPEFRSRWFGRGGDARAGISTTAARRRRLRQRRARELSVGLGGAGKFIERSGGIGAGRAGPVSSSKHRQARKVAAFLAIPRIVRRTAITRGREQNSNVRRLPPRDALVQPKPSEWDRFGRKLRAQLPWSSPQFHRGKSSRACYGQVNWQSENCNGPYRLTMRARAMRFTAPRRKPP